MTIEQKAVQREKELRNIEDIYRIENEEEPEESE
jgi:hypothetical protein